MQSIKYRNKKSKELTHDRDFFTLQMRGEYPTVNNYQVDGIIEIISECIIEEERAIKRDIAHENLYNYKNNIPHIISEAEEKIIAKKKLLLSLEDMEKMKNPDHEIDTEVLEKRSDYYIPLLYFFNHSKAPEEISFYTDMELYNKEYQNDRNKLREFVVNIFDSIKESTIDFLQYELSKELPTTAKATTSVASSAEELGKRFATATTKKVTFEKVIFAENAETSSDKKWQDTLQQQEQNPNSTRGRF
jgi:hypothetical protein